MEKGSEQAQKQVEKGTEQTATEESEIVSGASEHQQLLLRQLEAQNRLLEEDTRCHTKIMYRSGSVPSISSMDSNMSLKVLENVSHHSQESQAKPESPREEAAGKDDGNKEERRGSNDSGSSRDSDQTRLRSQTESALDDMKDSERDSERDSDTSRLRSQSVKEDGLVALLDMTPKSEGGGGERTAEEDLWLTWSTLMKSWEESSKKNHKLIKQLARQGIPEHLRGMAWQLLADSHDPELKDLYPVFITEVSPFERQIQRDLARTFPEHSFFKERDGLGQESLLNVMKAYSVFDREVGYCQGSPFITGLLLMQMPEEEAFCVLVKLMTKYQLREVFKPTMADLGIRFYQMEKMVEEYLPQLHMHFQALGFQTSMYASSWFLTMFASVLSLNVVFRIMDIFLVEGREIIFRVGLALLECSQTRLMQLDMEDMLKHFQKEMKVIHEADPDALIKKALKIKYNSKKMKKIEKEYLYRKEKRLLENTELTRLQNENTDMAQRIIALEKECASLADRLIQGQVTRAQEAEEMFIIKKELAKAKRKLSEIEESPLKIQESPNVEIDEEKQNSGVEGGGEEPLPQGRMSIGSLNDERVAQDGLVVKAPGHVCREEAEQVLKVLGVKTPGTSPRISLDESPKPVLSKGKRKSTSSVSSSSSGNGPDTEQLTKELAHAKLQCAEVTNNLDQKRLELKQALQREALVLRELQAAKQCISTLEQKLAEVQMEKLQCPHCSQRRGQQNDYSGPADPQSSEVLFSHLRAMWNSTAATNGDPRNSVGFTEYEDGWT